MNYELSNKLKPEIIPAELSRILDLHFAGYEEKT